ncbi:hypothetical protein FOZ63_015870, partial [Perkinsus olseni]
VLDTSVRCNVCNLFMDTDGMDEEEVRKVEYDHRADPAHVTRREKLRKRFGICAAFNREIERVKGHRVKLALSANGRPRHFWCTCCDAHLKSPEAVHFHTGINAHRSNLEYHDWCSQVGQDPRLYYKAGWHFPAKDSPKEECALPKLDDMKTEDISYLTKGEAAGANYCCRCNVTLASPWEIRQHLRTRSHRERSAVGYTVDERPPLIELEADISLKEYDDDDVKAEGPAFDGKTEVKTEISDDADGNMAEVDHIPTRVQDIPDVDKEIEEVWGVNEDVSLSDAADGGERGEGNDSTAITAGGEGAWDRQPTADEFDKMVSSIINGEEISLSSSSSACQQK